MEPLRLEGSGGEEVLWSGAGFVPSRTAFQFVRAKTEVQFVRDHTGRVTHLRMTGAKLLDGDRAAARAVYRYRFEEVAFDNGGVRLTGLQHRRSIRLTP